MANTRPARPKRTLPVEDEAVNGDNVVVEIDGLVLEVLPMRKWKTTGAHAMQTGDFEVWAMTCLYRGEVDDDGEELAPDSYAVWRELDPDVEKATEVFNLWREAGGAELKLGRSSRPTPSR